MPIVSSPPPASGARKPAAAPKKAASLTEQRTDALSGLAQVAQVPLIAFRQYAHAATVGIHAPNIARELAKLAETQEPIAKLVDPLIKVGPYAGLVGAILPFILQTGVNMGRIPAGAMGTVPPNSLAAQMEASIASAEMQALQEQLEAERAAQRIRDEIKAQRKLIADSQASQAATVE